MSRKATRQPSRMQPADLGDAHRTYRQEALFEAVVTAGVAVAVADGKADDAERTALVHAVGRSELLSTFTPDEAIDAFDSRAREFELAGAIPAEAIAALGSVTDRAGINEVVNTAERVATADGRLHPAEAATLRAVRSAVAGRQR